MIFLKLAPNLDFCTAFRRTCIDFLKGYMPGAPSKAACALQKAGRDLTPCYFEGRGFSGLPAKQPRAASNVIDFMEILGNQARNKQVSWRGGPRIAPRSLEASDSSF